MKKYLKKILSILLAGWMVIITGGLHVFAHECDCCDEVEISVVQIDECCVENAHDMICHEEADEGQNNCCNPLFDMVISNDHSCTENHCCSITHSYFRLDESFNKSTTNNIKTINLFVLPAQELDLELLVENENNKPVESLLFDKPPGFYGKAFLLFTQHLKIPISL